MSNGVKRLLRAPQEPRRVVYLELFFDLAFLLALARLSSYLLEHLDLSGAAHTLLLLAPIYWLWVTTTWAADWYNPDHRLLQTVIVSAMLGALLMAATVPKAFGAYAPVFAGAYVAVHVCRGLILLPPLRGDPAVRRVRRALVWFLLTGVLWLGGAALPAAQGPLWTVAIVADAAAALAGWPVPGLGRTAHQDLQTTGSRLAERLQQIFIIAVGELILTAGIAFSVTGLTPATTAAFVLAFVHAAMLALIYYTPAGRQLGSAIDRSEYPAYVGQTAVYFHLMLIAAVIISAVGDQLLIVHADRPPRLSTVVVAVCGTALFLVARLTLSAVTYRRLSLARLAGLLAIVCLTPVAFRLRSFAVVAAIDLVLIFTAVSDYLIERRTRPGRAG